MIDRVVKYLGHEIILEKHSAFIYQCSKCDLFVWKLIDTDEFYIQKNNTKLNITCDEMMIKKLLE